ncbi:MAG TPA: hypothetical protein VIR63_01910 [Pontiella sp.]
MNCGKDTLLKREPKYDGLTKTGEKLTCSSCGFEYASETEVPFQEKATTPKIFTDADRSAKIEVFEDGENQQLCRYCANYIINPFTQFCSIHKKEVQSTDSCRQFQPSTEKIQTNPLF